jgi:hypothetical protein
VNFIAFGEEVSQNLLEPVRIREHHRRGRRLLPPQLHLAALGIGAIRLEDARDDRARVDRPELETHLPGHDAGHVEQVVHQPGLRARVPLDDVESARHRGCIE